MEMTQDVGTQVGVVVKRRGTGPAVPPGAGSLPSTVERLPAAGCEVAVELSGGEPAFDVSPRGKRYDAFLYDEQLEWSWTVTAKTPGEHPLILSVAIVLHEPGIAAMQVAEEEYEATIHVAVRPDQRTIWTRVNDVLREPIPAALLTIGLAGLSAKGAATWWDAVVVHGPGQGLLHLRRCRRHGRREPTSHAMLSSASVRGLGQLDIASPPRRAYERLPTARPAARRRATVLPIGARLAELVHGVRARRSGCGFRRTLLAAGERNDTNTSSRRASVDVQARRSARSS